MCWSSLNFRAGVTRGGAAPPVEEPGIRAVAAVVATAVDHAACVRRDHVAGPGRARRAQAARLVQVAKGARSESGPPQGGAALVEERPVSTSGRKKGLGLTRRERAVGIVLLLVYVGGLALLAWSGEPQQAALWLLGVVPALFGGLIVVPSLRWAWKRWTVRRRGVTVVAVLARRERKRTFFRYTDLGGGTHEIEADYAARGIGGDPTRIEVVYDRRQPDRAICSLAASTLLWRTAGVTLAGGLLLSLAFIMMPLQLILMMLAG